MQKFTGNYMVDSGLQEQVSTPATGYIKRPPYIDTIKQIKQPQQAKTVPEYEKFGFKSQQELDLVKDVKKQGGTAQDAQEILEQFRNQKTQKVEPVKEDKNILQDLGGALKVESKFDVDLSDNDTLLGSMKNSLKQLANAGRFAVNLPGDTAEFIGDVGQLIMNPIDTAKGVLDLGDALAAKIGITEDGPEKEAIRAAVSQSINDNFGSFEKAMETMQQNPFDTLTTVFSGAGVAKAGLKKAGASEKVLANLDELQKMSNPLNVAKAEYEAVKGVLKPVVYLPKEATVQILGKTTGAGAEAIRTAFSKGGNESFAKAMRGEITDTDILESANKGLQTIKQQRREIYGEDYAKLQANKTKLGTSDIENTLIKDLEDARVQIIDTDKGLDLDFSNSTITQPNSQNQIKQMFDDVIYWTDDTPEGLDVLKQRIQDRWIGGEGTGKADIFSTKLSNMVKNKVVAEVPEYAKMTQAYEKLTNEIREIEKVLRVGDPKTRMTAITRLGQSMKDNLSMRKEMVEQLESLADIDLKSSIAGASLRDITPRGMAGAIYGGGLGYGLASGLFSPAVIGALLTSSPRLIGEFARAVGVTTNTLKKGLQNAQELLKRSSQTVRTQINEKAIQPALDKAKGLGDDIKDSLGNKLDDLADKTGARAKFMDDGGTGISGKIDAPKELIEEAKKYKSAEEFIGNVLKKDKQVKLYRTSKSGNAHKDIKDFTYFSEDKNYVKQYLRDGDTIVEYNLPESTLLRTIDEQEVRYLNDSRNPKISRLEQIWQQANK